MYSYGLKPNQYQTEYSFGIDRFSAIKDVTSDLPIRYTVDRNTHSIRLFFKKKLFNNTTTKINIHFIEQAKKENVIYTFWAMVPTYVKNTLARIKVNMSAPFIIYKTPDFLNKKKHGYIWIGNVKKGKQGLIYYTPNKVLWSLHYVKMMRIQGTVSKLSIKFLDIFENVLFQKVKIKRIITPKIYKRKGDYLSATYTKNIPHDIKYSVYAEVVREKNFKGMPFSIDFRKALHLSFFDRKLIRQFIKKEGWRIENMKKKDIAAFFTKQVFKYIKYDPSYWGKRLGLRSIIRIRRGVCEEYSTLLLFLLRYEGIPSLRVEGYAFTNYKLQYGWGPHTFILSYVDKKWQYFDPTWDIYSGYIPASHIIFRISYDRQDEIKTRYEYQGIAPKIVYYKPLVKIIRFK